MSQQEQDRQSVTRPNTPEAVTAEWMTEVLRSNGLDVTVGQVNGSTIATGVGMMSGLARLELVYSSGSGPESVIFKFPSTNEANLGVAAAFQLYRREVLYYRDVAPRSTAWTPTIYYADIADDYVDFALVMEDLTGYRLGDQIIGSDLADAQATVDWMAQQHASFWGKVDEATYDFLPYVAPSFSSETLAQGCDLGWGPMVEGFPNVIPSRVDDFKATYLAALPALFGWMSTRPLTVIHGDVRMDNLFYGVTQDHEPMVAVDWQGALRGRATQDLAYFMAGSVPTELRRAHERDLVARWHQGLVSRGVTDFTADDAWEDYRRSVAYVWIFCVVIGGTLDRTNERAHQWMSAMIERSIATMDDLGIFELITEMAGNAD
jgi:hypothetical protein